MESSRPLRAASAPDEAPTAVHETEPIRPVTEPESLAPALASGDQCANCGSHLAPDQHYCLVCGERRGPARFSAIPTSGTVTTTITEQRLPVRPPRFSSAATLIAGVATLLIAMGIGVYIGGLGKSNNSGSGQPVRVLTVGGGSAAPIGTTAATAATGGSNAGNSKHKTSTGSKKSGSAAKVVTTVKNLPPPTVTVGASGSGKGYQKGKFTGHFFGP
jgi:uncharacterized OB-fold protein